MMWDVVPAGAFQPPVTKKDAVQINRIVLAFVRSKFGSNGGYPTGWRMTVSCAPPKKLKDGSRFRCTVHEQDPGFSPQSAGSLNVRVSNLKPAAHRRFTLSLAVSGSLTPYVAPTQSSD